MDTSLYRKLRRCMEYHRQYKYPIIVQDCGKIGTKHIAKDCSNIGSRKGTYGGVRFQLSPNGLYYFDEKKTQRTASCY